MYETFDLYALICYICSWNLALMLFCELGLLERYVIFRFSPTLQHDFDGINSEIFFVYFCFFVTCLGSRSMRRQVKKCWKWSRDITRFESLCTINVVISSNRFPISGWLLWVNYLICYKIWCCSLFIWVWSVLVDAVHVSPCSFRSS